MHFVLMCLIGNFNLYRSIENVLKENYSIKLCRCYIMCAYTGGKRSISHFPNKRKNFHACLCILAVNYSANIEELLFLDLQRLYMFTLI